ncbi:MAG: MBL fold metallo-hydrolase [Clostridiales bacterium]|nr:MBL fold metallo-hydrolase [Clostridiales bacterium]
MKFLPLGSSSHGNAYLVDDGESVLLIECGVSFRRLGQLVRGAGYSVSRLAGCLVSHEHKDHSRCWDKLLEAGVPVYMSHGTMQALGAEGAVPLAPEVGQDVGEPVEIGSWKVLPFRTFHDAREPVGFLLLGADGDKLAFATDTANLRYRFPGLNLLAIEANYWDVILSRQTRMPEQVVRRIRNSHMEIGTLCGYLSSLPLEDCREIFLLHLSDACSDEAWFEEAVRRCVPPQVRVTVCQKGG